MKLVREDIVTCLTTIKKSSLEAESIDYIVIGTENGMVYCVDTQAFTVLARFSTSGAAVFIHAAGVKNSETFSICITILAVNCL